MYTIEYLDCVRDDLKLISKTDKDKLKKAIEKKLSINPIEFGKPLQYSLKGLRRLRVGDYRVIFQIGRDSVLIVKIGHQKDVYE